MSQTKPSPCLLACRVGIVSDNVVADSIVSTGEHHGEASQTHLHELLIAASAVVDGSVMAGIEDIRLYVPIGEGMHPWGVCLVVHGQ